MMKEMRIGLSIKDPMVEYNMRRKRMSRDEVLSVEASMGKNIDRIVASEERQLLAASKVRGAFDFATEIDIYDIFENKKRIPKFDAVISLGGDNHFQRLAQLYKDAILIPVNSDPVTSHGGILGLTAEQLIEKMDSIRGSNFGYDRWTMIATYKNGLRLPDAVCNVDFPASHYMARYLIKAQDGTGSFIEEQKASRAVIATGAGSGDGSHYNSIALLLQRCHPEQFPGDIEFGRVSRVIKGVSETPFRSGRPQYSHLGPIAGEGESIEYTIWHERINNSY
ncbi:hypothetical protein H6503_05070 [Candidatus Woesearchaeota archaeon]|nr:hypothetical protein [Candidatus Woesearchaeota archaeon]